LKKYSSTTKKQHPASNKKKQNTERNIHQIRKKKSFYNQNTFPNSEKKNTSPTHREKSTHSGWVEKQGNALKPRVSPAICQASNHLRLSFSLAPAGDLSFRVGRLKKKTSPEKLWRVMLYQLSGQIIAASAEVTPNGGLVRESPKTTLNSGL